MTSFQSAPAFRNRPDLPSSEGEQASPPLARAEWPAAHAPGATILMIDDDEFVRLTTVRLLERSGYRVLTAADGDTGLELLQDHGATATAVLLDLGLPGRSGVSLLRHTRETNPGLPVLIASGYNDQQTCCEALRLGASGWLPKPFTAKELVQCIRQACMVQGAAAPAA